MAAVSGLCPGLLAYFLLQHASRPLDGLCLSRAAGSSVAVSTHPEPTTASSFCDHPRLVNHRPNREDVGQGIVAGSRFSLRRWTLRRQPRHPGAWIVVAALAHSTWTAEEHGEGEITAAEIAEYIPWALSEARYSNRSAGVTEGVERHSSPSSVCRRRAGARLATVPHLM
ncbi:hypothetical protein HYPSUDRAFT_208310 [Hypholoma sublateritium FD-334 SS-4]|uniref:Uncharacterized protein n=1 Tax=Hypholoma sublateritium (strain FD-334 SS-4) TaxID=945553 RepID=A0A0D2N704_HYPSF|nr:hypothetical protein HYPSUDRAFT_208310 [Hypholoma sublateritium FD-334 SS-4]